MQTKGLATALAVMLSVAPTHGEELFSYFQRYDDPSQAQVEFSPCTGDEVDECISHILSCNKSSGGQPQFTIVADDIEFTSSLLARTNGQAIALLKLADSSVNLHVASVEFNPNVFASAWDTHVYFDGQNDFWGTLNEKNSEGASLNVAGKSYPLAPQKGDGKKLVALKKACIALNKRPPATTTTAKPDCELNSRLYRSPLPEDSNSNSNSYQELQFLTGTTDGTVDLTEYRKGEAVWVAHGSFTCSNGASICRVNFPLMLGEAVELPYERTDNSDSSPEMVVIPALRQNVFQTEQYAEMQGKSYGGFVADLLGGFKPKEDELTLPYNVYTYTGCKR